MTDALDVLPDSFDPARPPVVGTPLLRGADVVGVIEVVHGRLDGPADAYPVFVVIERGTGAECRVCRTPDGYWRPVDTIRCGCGRAAPAHAVDAYAITYGAVRDHARCVERLCGECADHIERNVDGIADDVVSIAIAVPLA